MSLNPFNQVNYFYTVVIVSVQTVFMVLIPLIRSIISTITQDTITQDTVTQS